jgi:cytochrome c oxidase subunit II
VSLELPSRFRRAALGGLMVTALLILSGCSAEQEGEIRRLAMPVASTEEAPFMHDLWMWSWLAAMITGLLVWGLIFYVSLRYRRRAENEIPVQTRYNLPLEIFYTIAPVVMVIVFFAHTVRAQNIVLEDEAPPDNIIEVTGQQWSWTFNYGIGDPDNEADDDRFDAEFPYDSYVHDSGTGAYIPELYLPVDETTRFNLHSPDVIHDFGVPAFLMKMDVVPGRVNHYVITPTREGVFTGKCYELCGVYHSRMLFEVHVVSREEYEQHLQELEDAGRTAEKPLIGGEDADSQEGLEAPDAESGSGGTE